ncbi:hypothetical protein AURANDRAFT_63392 [Aureococcus anophagefferens]|uniref:Major facilitator superfamily (MFS) profile domain-containing protein n=1 Tax=Aureococcus anophagefferens TaxID=44056 RepID=F0Y718_AURAN|nr:hypothetical protein AURANDRAFT_63392 [Aureococcus anophagefferens]EGB09314.1 hypothetical protein AURANDRAFT_63392 [Aureococcus anophagefferens]|eukprot:XP_009036410.1 hypothetical protein AURANDRAFT_63392 [Aureococcus anophagefferens]
MAPAPRYSWFVLLILGLIYMQQQWSRYSLNYLYNVSADDDFTSIQAADSLSYADYGILTGYGFSATFCLAGLVAGRAADVSSRKLIIFAGCLIWNAALFMIGYSKTYAEVLLWRLALGFGQAFSNPASYSLIADYFPEAQRAQANGLFACGVGGGLASLCISMATSLGWRDACFLIAALGFGLAALEGLGVAEPGRGAAKPAGGDAGAPAPGPPKKTFKQALAAIFGNRLVVLAGYLPTFYGVVFPGYDDEYSYINAYVACGCFGALPFMAICCLAPNFYVSILLGLFLEYLVVATMQSALEPDCRALAIACFTLIATFFGSLAILVGSILQ